MTTRQSHIQAAKEAGARAIARRDMTRQEVAEHLGVKGYSVDVIEQATIELEAIGAIDDARVAMEFARRRIEEKGTSRELIETELLERGVDPAVIARVFDETAGQRDESAEALELARDRVRRSKPDLAVEMVVRRAFEFLRRRGYDEDTSLSAAKRATEEYLGKSE